MRALVVVLWLFASLASPQQTAQRAEVRSGRSFAEVAAPASLHSIPARPAGAMGGVEFARSIAALARAEREAAIVTEVLSGNVPDFLRRLQRVTLRGRIDEKPASVILWVTPDYLAIGSDSDFIRVPVDLYSAAEIASSFGMALPTRRIVDTVYAQSRLRLAPQPMTPGPRMTSINYFVTHNQRIEAQRAGRAAGALVAGHKKDIVITNRLSRQRTPRVAIYGWHRGVGDPIQPLSLVHGATYADYSHGLRLVGGTILVNGVERSINDALQDPRLARILSFEGPIRLPASLYSTVLQQRNPR